MNAKSLSFSHRILIVEDDPSLGDLLRLHLEKEGYLVDLCREGRTGLIKATSGNFDLLILDIMVPNLSGLEICRRVQTLSIKPITLILTSRYEVCDRVTGLDLGADDYQTKPFSIIELLARIRALFRRRSPRDTCGDTHIINSGELTINLERREVTQVGQVVVLTSTEFDLLSFLARHPGVAFSREKLLESVWGYSTTGYDHTVNTHINRLRGKIEPDPSRPRYVQTVRGYGYRFTEE